MVIASDEFWGTYTGILEGVVQTRFGTIAKVKIIENNAIKFTCKVMKGVVG